MKAPSDSLSKSADQSLRPVTLFSHFREGLSGFWEVIPQNKNPIHRISVNVVSSIIAAITSSVFSTIIYASNHKLPVSLKQELSLLEDPLFIASLSIITAVCAFVRELFFRMNKKEMDAEKKRREALLDVFE